MLRDVLVRRRWPRHAGPALRPLEQPSGRLLPRAGRHLLSAKQPATISRLESRLSADTTTFLSCALFKSARTFCLLLGPGRSADGAAGDRLLAIVDSQ